MPVKDNMETDYFTAESGAALDGSVGVPSETEILARLVTFLGQQPSRSLPLSEIREQLPPSLRPHAQETTNVRKWLHNFPGLLELSGEPGREHVCLTVGKPLQPGRSGGMFSDAITVLDGPSSTLEDSPSTAPMTPPEGAPRSIPESESANKDSSGAGLKILLVAEEAAGTGPKVAAPCKASGGDDIDDVCNPATVQLRGLPFRASVADIKAFLGNHAGNLAPTEQCIRLLHNRDGRPSGFARVQFTTPEAACACRQDMHRQPMGDRYVEVLACSDRDRKAKNRRNSDSADPSSGVSTDANFDPAERDRLLQECREHMRHPDRHHLLLSTLGTALSAPSRAYLRRMNLGLKHFLARFPHEFRVEGPKGGEKVIWAGAGCSIPTGADPFSYGVLLERPPGNLPLGKLPIADPVETVAAADAAAGAGLREPLTPTSTPLHGAGKQTPHHVIATPSDWGTPGPGLLHAHPGGQASCVDPWGSCSGWPQYSAAASTLCLQQWANAATAPSDGLACAGGAVSSQNPAASGARAAATAKKGSRAETTAARSHAHLHPQSHPFAHALPGAVQGEPPPVSKSCLRLRGLPFSMTVQDVLAFVAQHEVAERIADVPNAAQLLLKANGRPSGQAVIQMRSCSDAAMAQSALQGQVISGRYIEVFVYGDEGLETNPRIPDAGVGAPPPAPPVPPIGGASMDIQGQACFGDVGGPMDPSVAGLGWRPNVAATGMQWDQPLWGAPCPPPVFTDVNWISLFNDLNIADGAAAGSKPEEGGPVIAPVQVAEPPPGGTMLV